MVHEEFIERQFSAFVGPAENRTSGPTVLEPAALHKAPAEESSSASALAEPENAVLASGAAAQTGQPLWQVVARAKGRPGYFLAKRCLDVALTLICIAVLSPVFLVTTLLVRLTSRGPAFYRQERVGYDGRPFTMLKFRSMYVQNDESLHRIAYEQFLRGERMSGKVDGALLDAEQPNGANATLEKAKKAKKQPPSDPRITPVGNFLRRSSIDELPQLFNVLRGEMSLVGPRPPIPYEVGLYQPWHLKRLDTLPGMTGFWQVYGRSRVTFERMVEMDLEYIEKQSFWYDIKLLFLTIPAVLNRKGAS
jgi:lipopolysaccharide/colanic/teichoic acid biosynthesis glycosyltransferase